MGMFAKKYTISAEEQTDGTFRAICQEVPGVEGAGGTEQEAVEDVAEQVKARISAMLDAGMEPPESAQEKKLTDEQIRALEADPDNAKAILDSSVSGVKDMLDHLRWHMDEAEKAVQEGSGSAIYEHISTVYEEIASVGEQMDRQIEKLGSLEQWGEYMRREYNGEE